MCYFVRPQRRRRVENVYVQLYVYMVNAVCLSVLFYTIIITRTRATASCPRAHFVMVAAWAAGKQRVLIRAWHTSVHRRSEQHSSAQQQHQQHSHRFSSKREHRAQHFEVQIWGQGEAVHIVSRSRVELGRQRPRLHNPHRPHRYRAVAARQP